MVSSLVCGKALPQNIIGISSSAGSVGNTPDSNTPIFALACANMLIHKDGKTNLEHLDSRTQDACDWIKSKNITKVLMNPPFENDKEYTREEINALGEVYGEIFIYLRELPESDITVENLADTILQVKNEFDANNIKFNKITVQLSGYKSGIYWMYIPYEIINESDILQLTTENSTYDQYYD